MEYVSKDLIQTFESYDWPGNVRELEKMVVYGMSMVSTNCNRLCLKDVEDKFHESLRSRTAELLQDQETQPEDYGQDEKDADKNQEEIMPLTESVAEYERNLIAEAYRKAHGKLVQAAKILGIPRQTLQRKIKKYKITY
ncbi:helix-turn-helix domain-containing protein [Acidaminococcus sp. LBK-2]|uniref:helix-turn-helix domain-containing protein n=1 Tax=Acidaminococcus sp. LBK-2 TaxID=3456956 RepID=UPI003FA46B3F